MFSLFVDHNRGLITLARTKMFVWPWSDSVWNSICNYYRNPIT